MKQTERKGSMKAFHEVRTYHSDFMVWQSAYRDISFVAHWHQEIELMYVRSGTAHMSINEHTFTARKGDLVIVDTGDFHYCDSRNARNELDFLIFDPSVVSSFYHHSNFAHPLISSKSLKEWDLAGDVETLYASIHRELENQDKYYKEIVTATLRSFWYRIRRRIPRDLKDQEESGHSRMLFDMQKLLSYMDIHYADNITLSFAAEKMNFSESYFSRVFKRIIGINFISYLNLVRIEHAAQALKNTSQKVTEIALNCGFNNIRTFNRVFKDITGYTPSQFVTLTDPDSINLSYYKRKSPEREFVENDSLTLVRNKS